MPIFAETESKIFGDILFDVVNATNITRTSPGSKTRALAQATSKKMGRMWKQFDINMVQAFLPGAETKYLDYLGAMMGLPRLGEVQATATATQRVVRFYVDIGEFGDINSGSSIYLPTGTIVSTGQYDTGIRYRLTNAVYLPLDQSEMFVSVEAIQTGTGANIGTGQLIYHTFTNYTDAFNSSLKVTNISEISAGQEIESDVNYRFRIANQTVAAEQANLTAVRLAALTTPGVADVALIPYFRGIGTYDLLLKSVTPSVPVSLISAVTDSVFRTTAQGIVSNIRGPIEVGMGITGTLTLRRSISSTEQNNITRAVTSNVSDYVNSLDIGEDFIVNEVVERVMATSDIIKNIGEANKPLDLAYIYRPSSLEDNKIRSKLVGDYDPDDDEKLLVETVYGGETPILFRVAA
jgi:uncharacterized phage protein gp47/JayE